MQAEAITAGAGITAALGSGVRVTDVQRLYDSFLTDALRSSVSSEQRAQVLTDLTARLDNLLGNPELGIGTSIQAFFDQAELLGRDPTSASTRQQLLLQGESLAQRFQQLGSQLGALGDEVDRRVEDSVSRINAIAASLAQINETVGRGASSANDLLDQRDALLAQLTGQIDATIVKQVDGTVSVMIGNGQPLVLGIRSAELTMVPDQFDPTRHADCTSTSVASCSRFPARSPAARWAGSWHFAAESLDPALRDLGLLAASLPMPSTCSTPRAWTPTAISGVTFSPPSHPRSPIPRVTPAQRPSTPPLPMRTALQARDYELRFNGSAWSSDRWRDRAVNHHDGCRHAGKSIPVRWPGSYRNRRRRGQRPVPDSAGRRCSVAFPAGVSVKPTAIAAAAPVRTDRSLSNASDARIELVGIADVTDPALRQPVEIRFESAGTFRIYDSSNNDLSGPLAYTSGADISFNGWTVRISGAAANADSFDRQASHGWQR